MDDFEEESTEKESF